MIIDRIQKQEDEFRNNFSCLKGKKLVIYGTGRKTKNILSRLADFDIVGLLDGNPDNIGKKIGRFSIISIEEAEKLAECIIIITSEIYWDIIYRRIGMCKLPIYLGNGVLAKDYYKPFSMKELLRVCNTVEEQEIIDTLNCCLPDCKNEEIVFSSWYDWVYTVWGVVIWSYLSWLYEEALKDGCRQLLFLSRDGFLLMEAYKKFVKFIDAVDYPEPIYVISSRRCTYAANINTTNFKEYLSYFFNGTFEEYMDIRFSIKLAEEDLHKKEIIELPKDISVLMEYIKPYEKIIADEINDEKKNYKRYLKTLNISHNCGIVDTGYTGKIADCLSEILGQDKITAYYFYGNTSKDNDYAKYIKTCFQKDTDLEAEHCNIYKYIFMVETVLSAPYGTAIKATKNGFIYEEKKENFLINREIYAGAEKFIADIIKQIKRTNNHKNKDRKSVV